MASSEREPHTANPLASTTPSTPTRPQAPPPHPPIIVAPIFTYPMRLTYCIVAPIFTLAKLHTPPPPKKKKKNTAPTTPAPSPLHPHGLAGPGGWLLLPQPGHWVQDPSGAVVTPCRFPSHERCVGWDPGAGRVQCGVGYDPAAPACGACAVGWFPEVTGRCERCPQAGRARNERVGGARRRL
jgi:hypothetical protein